MPLVVGEACREQAELLGRGRSEVEWHPGHAYVAGTMSGRPFSTI